MMETNKEAAEENPSAKSSGSIVQINSIYIELPLAPTEMSECGCCDHSFSIRGFTFAKRGSNQNLSSLFPSIGNSGDQKLPPMEIPRFRHWRCTECHSKEMQKTGIQQGSNIETSDAIRSIGTPETTEENQSIGTNAVIQQGLTVGTVEDSRSIGTRVGVQQGPTAQATEGIRSICTTVGIQKGPMAQTTEVISSIGTNVNANANTVEFHTSLPNPQKITAAKAVDIACTGDKNQRIEPRKDAAEKVSDEGRKVKTGGVTSVGNTEVPAEKLNTESGNISTRSELHKTASRNKQIIPSEKEKPPSVASTANGTPGKIDETEGCKDNDNTGPRRKMRKVRLLTDLLGEMDNLRVNTTERNPSSSSAPLESAGSGNAVSEGQVGPGKDVANGVQSPRRKSKVNREDEDTNDSNNPATDVTATKKDTGKAVMVIDVPKSDAGKISSGGEGLFIGTKTERLRRRSDITPSASRKKNKQSELLDFSSSIPPSLRSPPTASAAGSWGSYPSSEQTDRNYAGLLSGSLKFQPSYNRSTKMGLDLSLNSFAKRNPYQGSASKGFLKKDGILFGGSNTRPAAELERSCSRGPSWDLNERAALISYNFEKNKFPVCKEMDFLQLGLKEKSSVQGNLKENDQRADDIPMDIVELLAKQQYERRNSNTGDNPLVHRTSDTTRRFFDGEMIGPMKQLTRGYPGFPCYPPLDAQRGATMANENARTNKGSSVTFSQMSRNHLKLVQTEENLKSIFDTFPQSQQKSTSGMHISPAASVRAGLQFIEGVEPLLSSTSAKLTYGFGIQQKQVAPQHQGKTISDIKADELKKTEEARLVFTKQGGGAIGSKAKGSLDAYANESIPALQLLSLMDGRSSGTVFGLGTTKILDKPFSPCSYHPRFSRDERHDFLNGSLFLRQSHPKEPSSLRPTLSTPYQSSRPHSAALSNHMSFMTPEKDMSRDKSQKPGSSIGGGPSAAHEKPNAMINGSNLMASSQQHQRATYSGRMVFQPISLHGGVRPGRNISADGVCRTNRNPADFSFPEAGNMYTICGKDLKSRKRKPYTRRNPIIQVDDAEMPRVKKAKLGNDHPKEN